VPHSLLVSIWIFNKFKKGIFVLINWDWVSSWTPRLTFIKSAVESGRKSREFLGVLRYQRVMAVRPIFITVVYLVKVVHVGVFQMRDFILVRIIVHKVVPREGMDNIHRVAPILQFHALLLYPRKVLWPLQT